MKNKLQTDSFSLISIIMCLKIRDMKFLKLISSNIIVIKTNDTSIKKYKNITLKIGIELFLGRFDFLTC